MGQTASRNDQSKEKSVVGLVSGAGGVAGERSIGSKNGSSSRYIGKTKTAATTTATTSTTTTTIEAATKTNQAEESAANAATVQQQRLKQTSNWSLGSLSGRLNWSFTGASRNSFRNRSKSSRKGFTSQQQQQQQQQHDHLRRSKSVWHKPLTNAIFNSHFKESSRNEEFHIEDLVAKGAFGVVFKVIDKRAKVAQVQQQATTTTTRPLSPPKLTTLSAASSSLLSPSSYSSFSSSSSFTSPAPAAAAELLSRNKATTSLPSTSTSSSETQFTYALKVLKKSKIIAENSVQQIKDEADIQKICGHHPFIVQQIDLWQNRHNLHILSEFVPNGELFSKIADFSIDLIRLYLAEIALALDFLHNAGIIYRDAKPENILLTANYHIKLIDFGLSKWLKLGATTKTMCGTFQYMAPEILRGEPYGHAVDWWSLGVIACQMLTKKGPDVRHFLQFPLPPELNNFPSDETDNARFISPEIRVVNNVLPAIKSSSDDSINFLPSEVENLTHESKDVLKRLLTIEPKKRIRSVMALQRIAMYKDFKIEANRLLNLRPLDIIERDNTTLLNDKEYIESSSQLATKAFQGF